MTTEFSQERHEHQLDWVEQFNSTPTRCTFLFSNGEAMEFSQHSISTLQHDACIATAQEIKNV